jgi:hypothetical protein
MTERRGRKRGCFNRENCTRGGDGHIALTSSRRHQPATPHDIASRHQQQVVKSPQLCSNRIAREKGFFRAIDRWKWLEKAGF